jgi:hypothetical protein
VEVTTSWVTGLSVGDYVTFSNLISFNGINPNNTFIVTSILALNKFTFLYSIPATGTGSGGGSQGKYFDPKKRTNKFALGYKNTFQHVYTIGNPVATTLDSNKITVYCWTNHNLLAGDLAVISDIDATNGFKAEDINGYKRVAIIDSPTAFSYYASSKATSTGTGGGTGGKVSLKEALLNCAFLRLFGLK